MLHGIGTHGFRSLAVPVTRLSQLFHERFGDEIADEVVNWFNAVETNSRSDLREINELNFARFDAKLEQRFAEQDARIEKRFAEQDARIEKRFAEQDARIEKRFAEQDARIEKRFAEQDARIEKRFAEMEIRLSELEKRFVGLEAKLDTRLSDIQTMMERSMKEHARWMQLSWGVVIATLVALGFRS
jgi:hypothetical protein